MTITTSRNNAGFGQIDYSPWSRLHLSAGERYVYANETFSEVGGGFFDLGGAGTNGTPYRQSATSPHRHRSSRPTYDLSAHTSIYATIAKGFRLGGATTPNTNVSCVAGLSQLGFSNAPNTYGSDQLWSYEGGAKACCCTHPVDQRRRLLHRLVAHPADHHHPDLRRRLQL